MTAYLGNPHDSPIWQELADALDQIAAMGLRYALDLGGETSA